MSWMKMPFTILGQYVSATAMVAIFAAGCGGLAGSSGDLFGTIVNTDTSKDLIGGVRLRTEEAVYAFGAFNSSGAVGDITSIVFRDKDGKLATLYFESGRPVRAVGPDGSRLEIIYTQATSQRLTGQVILSPAGSAVQTYDFDVDLAKTAQDIANLVQQLLNVQISDDAPPSDSSATGRGLAGTSADAAGAGADPRDRTVVEASVVLAVPVVLVVTGFTINLVLSQILQAMLNLADAVAKSVIVAVLTPFIFMGNLMRLAVGQPVVTLQYHQDPTGPDDVAIIIPRPQVF